MDKKRSSILKSLSRAVMAIVLVGVLIFSTADAALAARTGGRIGGGSFRRPAPTRSYQRPSSPSYPGGYSRGYGGGFGFPFLIPFFGFGGGLGGLFSILIVIAIANFLISSFRRIGGEQVSDVGGYDQDMANPSVAVNTVQVGLLATARELQTDLDRIAQTANTGSSEGLAKVLQETNLALLRHPEYWVYASAESQQTRLTAAEANFNQLALTERSKFQAETLSNVKQQLQQAAPSSGGTDLLTQAPGEYIVVTLLVASQGKLTLPKVRSSADLRQALNQLGSISSEQLLALEVLWTPQAQDDTLSSEDVLTTYPNLALL